MLVKQISVFVENTRGRLAKVTRILADNNINIRALSIADTTDFGILRLIVKDPEKAEQVLKENGITVKATDVIVIAINDTPGGLAGALSVLAANSIGVEYMYTFVGGDANVVYDILRTDNVQKAEDMLIQNGIKVVPAKDVYEL